MKQQQQYRIVILLTCMMALLVSAVSGSVVAREVYSWTDENGVVHFGDTPPGEQKAQTIEVQEIDPAATAGTDPVTGGAQPDAATDAAIRADAEGQETSPPQSAADARREKIARDRKERREARAEMDRMCAQHRQRLAGVEPNRRVIYRDDSGEMVRMDDDKRLALVEESRDFITKNCD